MTISDGDLIQKGGRDFRVNIINDTDMRAPWEEHDGHGVVSDWATRGKLPCERVLANDRSSYRYYDIKATMAIARADGWGLCDKEKAKLADRLGRPPTKREITAESVERDFEHLKGWCEDRWCWVGVVVTDITDDPDADNDYEHALWGIESSSEEHLEEVAEEFVDTILGDLAEAEALKRKELAEVTYWESRDVETVP